MNKQQATRRRRYLREKESTHCNTAGLWAKSEGIPPEVNRLFPQGTLSAIQQACDTWLRERNLPTTATSHNIH